MTARIVSTALLLFVFTPSVVAQPDTTKNFYPLQVGNAWQYRVVSGGSYDTSITTGEITGDTLMPNGKKYYLMDGQGAMRIDDSMNTYRYGFYQLSGEFLMDKLGAQVDETWKSYRGGSGKARMAGHLRDVLFGDTVETRMIVYGGSIDPRLIDFADRFGPYYMVEELGTRWFLIGAVINGKRYGGLLVSSTQTRAELPSDFVVEQSFPNPFNSIVTIVYHLPRAGEAKGEVYNTLGMKIRTVVPPQRLGAGKHSVRWDGRNDFGGNVGSGVYFIRLRWNDKMRTIRVVYLK